MTTPSPKFYVVGTPIGNLKEISLRALDTLKLVNVIYCEDTRHSLKLLNAYEIRKPLKSSPYFKEKGAADAILQHLGRGESVAFISDAGMPALSDPGATLVQKVRESGFPVEVIGGTTSLTHFIAGLGIELESFLFIGFLPPRTKDREKILVREDSTPVIFFESPHRIETTLDLLEKIHPDSKVVLAKELSKISENFYQGIPSALRAQIKSFKGEWIGCLFPPTKKGSKE